jgi:hypothetical protein
MKEKKNQKKIKIEPIKKKMINFEKYKKKKRKLNR